MEPVFTPRTFKGIFWIVLAASAIWVDFTLSQTSIPTTVRQVQRPEACQLIDDSQKPSSPSLIATVTDPTVGAIQVFFDFQRELLVQFSMQAWGIAGGIFREPTGHWFPPEDPDFSLMSCRDPEDTVVLSPNFVPSAGGSSSFAFTWSFNRTTYAEVVFRGVGITNLEEIIEFRSENVTRILSCGSQPCQNGGQCMEGAGSFGFVCLCTAGWIGTNCGTANERCMSEPCLNGATCLNRQTSYACACREGWIGQNCQVAFDVCVSNPCLNGATCVNQQTSYTCQCLPGWTGQYCGIINPCVPMPCQNGGTCLQSSSTDQLICVCAEGFIGARCENVFDACTPNPCPNAATCFTRNSAEGYVCECNIPDVGGYDCSVKSDNQHLFTCYGSTCSTGVFASENYPNNYPNRYRALYLIYTPGANGFTFTFDTPFQLEPERDELYFGSGLIVPFNAFEGLNTTGGVFFFDGYNVPTPSSFTVPNTDTIWMYFITDKNREYAGFQVRWNIIDQLPPVISGCPGTILRTTTFNSPISVVWPPITAEDASGFSQSASHSSGDLFPLGTTTVTYTFTDVGGRSSICRFDVRVSFAIDVCMSSPCINGGFCSYSGNSSYICECLPGFNGFNCENGIYPIGVCVSSPCINGGFCIYSGNSSYICECLPGFNGFNCENAIGVCVSSPCINGGLCIYSGNSSYICECLPGFNGFNCENGVNPCASMPCLNGGTCFRGEGLDHYICTCPTDYAGVQCQNIVAICDPNPCANQGTCIVGDNAGYTCRCSPGFTGFNCDTAIGACSSNPCQNGGTCTNVGQNFSCRCFDEYRGINCQSYDDVGTQLYDYICHCPYQETAGLFCEKSPCDARPCVNGGTCSFVNGTVNCLCPPGYYGDRCQQSPCSTNPCYNGGTCRVISGTFECRCLQGYSGDTCETQNACSSQPCSNRGTCSPGEGLIDYVCACRSIYIGLNCEVTDPCYFNPCRNRGMCLIVDGVANCTCRDGYFGDRCQLSSCSSQPCLNRGTCRITTENQMGYLCTCLNTHTGPNCEEQTPCAMEPCVNGGTCYTLDVGIYACLCLRGYSGDNCELDLAPPQVRCPRNRNVIAPRGDTEVLVTWSEPTVTDTSQPVSLISRSPPSGSPLPVQQVTDILYTYDDAVGNRAQCTFRITVDYDDCTPNPCLNGQCTDVFLGYVCTCYRGWTGSKCDLDTDECARYDDALICGLNGVCLDNQQEPGEYICTCAKGYEGSRCETDIDECASGPCMAGSTCYNQINGFICFCPNGRFGTNCEFALSLCEDSLCSNGGICYARPAPECRCFTNTAEDKEGCIIHPSCDVNTVLEELAGVLVTEVNIELLAEALANATSIYNRIDSTGIAYVARVLENIVREETSSSEVTENIITTVDNILNIQDDEFAASFSAPSILESFETQLTFVQENLIRIEENVAVEVVLLPRADESGNLSYASIPRNGTIDNTLENNDGNIYFVQQDVPVDTAEASISLPREAFDQISQQDSVPVVFTVYLTPRLFQLDSPGPHILPDGSQLLVNSRIISSTIGTLGEKIQNLFSPVITSFIPLNATLTNQPTCVFWDTVSSNWSSAGCTQSMDMTGTEAVVCNCDHLTSFAILVSYKGDINDFVLDVISKIGCGISIAALCVTIMTRLVVRELHNNPAHKSLINMCVSLTVLYAVFLAGIDQAQSPILCVVMAALIQYFFLTSVCWSSVEAMNLFYLLVITKRRLLTGYFVKVLIFCWGVPLIVVVYTYLVPYLASGQSTFDHAYCFLPPGLGLYIGVLLPVGLLLLFNTFIFTLLVRRLVCQRVESSLTRRETPIDTAIRHARVMLPVSLILGATWLVGFFAVNEATRVFQWVFAILNAFLGLIIFLVFTLAKKPGRRGLKKLLLVDQIRSVTSSHSTR